MKPDKKKLYLIRHGQTEMNVRNLKQGSWDSPLTELGKKQADITSRYFKEKKIPIDHAYSSPSARACDTLERISDLPYRRIPGLRELSFGVYEAQPFFLGSQKKPYLDYYKAYGGDDEAEVSKRMNEALSEIMEKEDHQNVLALSHSIASRCFAGSWHDLDQEFPGQFPAGNCTIFEFDYHPDTRSFTLEQIIPLEKQEEFLNRTVQKETEPIG